MRTPLTKPDELVVLLQCVQPDSPDDAPLPCQRFLVLVCDRGDFPRIAPCPIAPPCGLPLCFLRAISGVQKSKMAGMTPVENSGNKLLGSGRRKARTLDDVDKSLACFTRALQGSPVIVELRNATFVRGTLYMSDTCMKYVS